MSGITNVNAIRRNVEEILRQLPQGVTLVAAAKTRTNEEVRAAIEAGIQVVGHNYVQEAELMKAALSGVARWHLIGHLQKNKAKKAAEIFDMIETVDSFLLAAKLDRECADMGKVMPILIEINSGREAAKSGVLPEEAENLAVLITSLSHVRLMGFMTLGPFSDNPEDSRPYFKTTKEVFDALSRAGHANIDMRFLSMGMSSSWRVAIEEGANIIRIGTSIFGARS